MGYPSFASGDVLLAADMNAVGLWLVKTQTIGSAVSSQAVTDCFSASYDNYLITVSGGSSAAGASMGLQLGASTTGYYSGIIGTEYDSDTLVYLRDDNQTQWRYAGGAYVNGLNMMVTLFNPFAAVRTAIIIHGRPDLRTSATTTGASGTSGSGFHDSATSFTGFTIESTGTTMTGGTIRVYGYRN